MVLNLQPGTHTRVKTRAATWSDWEYRRPSCFSGNCQRTKLWYWECSKGKKKKTTRLQIHLKSYMMISMMLSVWGVAGSYFTPA